MNSPTSLPSNQDQAQCLEGVAQGFLIDLYHELDQAAEAVARLQKDPGDDGAERQLLAAVLSVIRFRNCMKDADESLRRVLRLEASTAAAAKITAPGGVD